MNIEHNLPNRRNFIRNILLFKIASFSTLGDCTVDLEMVTQLSFNIKIKALNFEICINLACSMDNIGISKL